MGFKTSFKKLMIAIGKGSNEIRVYIDGKRLAYDYMAVALKLANGEEHEIVISKEERLYKSSDGED